MPLSVYQGIGQADRYYENAFFRSFAYNLELLFKEKRLDGILLGHPECKNDPYLQPDCILIANQKVIIFDFKNYENEILLPDEDNFETGEWLFSEGVVKGGHSVNPFEQLEKKRMRLHKILNETIGNIGISDISTAVVFQGKTRIVGNIPGKYQYRFFITDRNKYLQDIADAVNVRSKKKIIDWKTILSRFSVKAYKNYVPRELDDKFIDAGLAIQIAKDREKEAKIREEEALRLIDEYKKKLKAIEEDSEEAKRIRIALEKAERAAEEARIEAERALKDFNDKKHELEKLSLEAKKAAQEAKKAEEERIKEEARQKTKRLILGVVATLIVILIIAASAWFGFSYYSDKQEQNAQRLEDIATGKAAISVDQVAQYEGMDGVRVNYYVGYVDESKKYIFLDDKPHGTFTALIMNKNIISLDDAKAQYLNKYIEVRGTITKYEDTYQIEVYSSDQLKVMN